MNFPPLKIHLFAIEILLGLSKYIYELYRSMYSRFSELSLHWLAYNFSFFWSVSDLAMLRLPIIIFILLSRLSHITLPKAGIFRKLELTETRTSN